MAYFDKISINGTSYDVRDSDAQSSIDDLSQTVDNHTQSITQNTSDIASLQSNISNLTKIPTVKDFGAVGDGVHDDTNAINTAITTCGCAVIPPGKYKTSETINLSLNQDIFGFGAKSSVILPSGNYNVITATGCVNSTIQGISIDGGNTANNGIFVNNSASVACISCDVEKCKGNGIMYQGSMDTVSPSHKIINCFAGINGLSGFYLNATDVSMVGCSGVSNGQIDQNNHANLTIYQVAAKVTNSHFFNVNDSLGYNRCNTSVNVNGPDVEIVACHIEGGNNNSLTIGSNAVRFLLSDSLVYATFGDSLVWCGTWGSHFSNTTFLGQATDPVSKPAFVQTLAGNPQDLWISNCYFSDVVCTNGPNYSCITAVCGKDFSAAFPGIDSSSCRGWVKCNGSFTNLGT